VHAFQGDRICADQDVVTTWIIAFAKTSPPYDKLGTAVTSIGSVLKLP
jgi:hypothetical protein